jgi:hypothetical protein
MLTHTPYTCAMILQATLKQHPEIAAFHEQFLDNTTQHGYALLGLAYRMRQ